MAIVAIFLSSLVGMVLSGVALFAFGATVGQALLYYVVGSVCVAALVLAGSYILMLARAAIAANAVEIRSRL